MSKITFLDSIDVESPCTESWNEMRGDEQIRFCSHCAKDVHNLSAMSRKNIRKLIAESNGAICVRYVRRADGRIQTLKNTLHQISRQTGIAAGVLGTSMAVSTLAHAQGEIRVKPNENAVSVLVDNQKSDAPDGTLSGTITDQNGAVVPFAAVTVLNEQTLFSQSASADYEGFYKFDNLPNGIYKIKFEASGFAAKELAQVSVSGDNQTQNAQLAIEIVQEVVTIGGNENLTQTVTVGLIALPYSNGKTNKLVLGVESDDLKVVKERIVMGDRVNAKDKNYDKNTALHIAVANGNLEIVELLLAYGAKTASQNDSKRTPLMMLDGNASVEIVDSLLRYGAKINAVDKQGNTPLILAAENGRSDVLQMLIGAGANVNAVNKQGETALMRAAENGELENVKLLLGAGANAQLRSKDGETALSMTSSEAVKQILISYGATE